VKVWVFKGEVFDQVAETIEEAAPAEMIAVPAEAAASAA
jgi:hypothetical protein